MTGLYIRSAVPVIGDVVFPSGAKAMNQVRKHPQCLHESLAVRG